MIIEGMQLTPVLLRWLRSRHDDGTKPLRVRQRGPDIEVTRSDGSELTESERAHVRGTISAHRVGGLK